MLPHLKERINLVSLVLTLALIGQAALPPVTRASAIQRSFEINASAAPASAAKARTAADFGRLPLSFEFNRGQADAHVKFLTHSRDWSLLLMPDAAVMNLHREKTKDQAAATASLRLRLPGANIQPRVAGATPLAGRVNYFIGSDERQWTRNVPTYARVKYEAVWPGIDLVWYGNEQQLEYDFIVAPGADARAIRLQFDGARKMRLDGNGDLVLTTAAGEVRHHQPLIYQQVNGERREIAGRYRLKGKNQVTFEIGAYDQSLPLVIDPTISYATYLNDIAATDLTTDAQGNVYVVGTVNNLYQPTPGALKPSTVFQSVFTGVMKINPQGTAVLYKAVIGGTVGIRDPALNRASVAVDAAGSAYLAGQTASFDFPTTPGALEPASNLVTSGGIASFVCKLSPAGSDLIYSTLLGSGPTARPGNVIRDIAVDALGNACVVGVASGGWPTTPTAFQPQPAPSSSELPSIDAFVTKLNDSGTGLIFSTYLGSEANEEAAAAAVDPAGNVYVAGVTLNGFLGLGLALNHPFPATKDFIGNRPGFFVAKFDPAGARVYSTIVAPADGVFVNRQSRAGLAVDAAGNAYLTGVTRATDLPVTPNAYQTTGGGLFGSTINFDVFVTKLNPTGDALAYATYYGKDSETDTALGISVDQGGNATVLGWSQGVTDPASAGRGFAVTFDAAGSKLLGTYNYSLVIPDSVAVDGAGNAYLAGLPANDFAVTPGALYPTSVLPGSLIPRYESVMMKIGNLVAAPGPSPSPSPSPSPTASPSPSPSTAPLAYYFIGGRVTDNQGKGMEKVRVVLSGSDSRADYTDRNGYYSLGSFANNGTYKVAVELQSIRVGFKTYYPNPGWYTFRGLTGDQRANFKYELTSPWVPPDDPTPTPTVTPTPTPTVTPTPGNDGSILNPGFEEGLANWMTSGIVDLERGRAAIDGTAAAKLQPTSPWRPTLLEQFVQLTPGVTYELSADVALDSRVRALLGVLWGESNGGIFVSPQNGVTRRVAVRFTVPAGVTKVRVSFQASGNVGAVALVDNFRLVRVN
ncbi:MAG TPA: carbohydrate binding domain-containing protein [Blastocatellia bacterium]|nr:carbohydrate binding domain-containing protein [Blastocatellia bacterium]